MSAENALGRKKEKSIKLKFKEMPGQDKKKLIIIIIIGALAILGYIFYQSKHRQLENLLNFEEAYIGNISQEKLEKKSQDPNAIRIPILVYHTVAPYYLSESAFLKKFDVEPKIFEKQLQYLKDSGYTFISFDALIDYFSQNNPLPPKPVIITFDDGWENQYKYAFPILKKENIAATFFIFTNAIGHKHFLTWRQVKELDDAGMIIGGHTKSHPYITKITSDKTLREEIIESKKIIENNLGKKINFFAYPFGHYNDKVIAIVKEAGYKTARSAYKGIYQGKDDLFTLKSVQATNDFNKFIELLNQ